MAKGLDFAFYPHPPVAAILGDGATFVCRYVSAYAPSDPQGKNLLRAEKDALLDAGLSIVIVAEEDAGRMTGGRAAGVADAAHADAVLKALGMTGTPVYFACDWDAAEAQQATINAYLDGAASVIGKARTGIYGGYYPVRRAFDAGKVTYGWQTYAWSGTPTLWDTRAQLRQVQNGVTVGGADCDRDVSTAADYGQWPRPGAPKPAAPLPAPASWQETSMNTLPTLTTGAAGEAVRTVQGLLCARGYPVTVDGSFGNITLGALRTFQSAAKLTVDGIAGPHTWQALMRV